MPLRAQEDEHAPLLPTHQAHAHASSSNGIGSRPNFIRDRDGDRSAEGTGVTSAAAAAAAAGPALGTASRSKLGARRYLSLSPDSAKRPSLGPSPAADADFGSAREEGRGQVEDEEEEGEEGEQHDRVGTRAGASLAPRSTHEAGLTSPTAAAATAATAAVAGSDPGRRARMSEKALGKQRADAVDSSDSAIASPSGQGEDAGAGPRAEFAGSAPVGQRYLTPTAPRSAQTQARGRGVTVIFANEGPQGGKVDVWVEEGESVGMVKDQIRHLHPPLLTRQLRLIHSGRLLTDGVLLLPWLRALEERVRRQAKGVGGDVEEVLREVGVGLDPEVEPGSISTSNPVTDASPRARSETQPKVFLHCTVGGAIGEKKASVPSNGGGEGREEGDGHEEEDGDGGGGDGAGGQAGAGRTHRRRGFDTLLDAGLSPADVANMRRQFYESRGEEVPDGLDRDDLDDEHARALEEQWIEGDMTAETATTTSEGQYSSILQGLLTGFLYPLLPVFFFREMPLPNFFEAEAEANGALDAVAGVGRSGGSATVGTEVVASTVFDTRTQMGVFLGLVINAIFGALRFMN